MRTTNLSARLFITGDSGPNCSRAMAPRVLPASSAICMLRESSISTPTKFCCDTAARTTRTGRNRQKRTRRQRGDPQRGEDEPVPHGGAAAACAAVGEHRRRDGQQHEGRRHVRTGRRHQTEIALLEDDRPITEEQLEERLEHVSDPAGAPRGANEPLSGQFYNRDTEAPQTIVTTDDSARAPASGAGQDHVTKRGGIGPVKNDGSR